MAMTSLERQQKYSADKKDKDMIRVSFWIDRKTWERFKKRRDKEKMDWNTFIHLLNKLLVSAKLYR